MSTHSSESKMRLYLSGQLTDSETLICFAQHISDCPSCYALKVRLVTEMKKGQVLYGNFNPPDFFLDEPSLNGDGKTSLTCSVFQNNVDFLLRAKKYHVYDQWTFWLECLEHAQMCPTCLAWVNANHQSLIGWRLFNVMKEEVHNDCYAFRHAFYKAFSGKSSFEETHDDCESCSSWVQGLNNQNP